MAEPSPPRPSPDAEPPALQQQLVSYLDGELDAEEASRVERALGADPQVRDELRRLERCWDLLDELPRTELGESFTRSTVEMIAVRAEEELAQAEAAAPAKRRRAWLAAAASLALAAAGGYLLVALVSPRENHELLSDLPVLEHLDEYRQIDDIQFLHMLKAKGFLLPEADHGP